MLSRRQLIQRVAAIGGLAATRGSISLSAAEPSKGDSKSFKKGVVATVQPVATEAGVNALRRGGNAVDAAIAAAVTLGVVDQHNSGLGGGCFILIRQANGKLLAIDGRETAPAKAFRDMYLRDGKPHPELSQTGSLAVATPGALAAYELALNRAGKLKLADVMTPAADVAESGFALDRNFAKKLKSTAAKLKQFPGTAAALLKSDGSPYAEGEILKQPELANTYRLIAKHGSQWFYRSEIAKTISNWMKENGGILNAEDFAAYKPVVREPLQTKYRQYQIIGFPPPSSGGVHVAQMLNMLEAFDLASLRNEVKDAKFEHVLAEVMKLAFADRAYWLGDPDFAKVPRGLIDKEYARELATRIMEKTVKVPSHGRPPRSTENIFAHDPNYDPAASKHTTHIAAADAEGNWVAITATVNTTFGSKVIVPGTGLVLNNEMDDFSISPGQPNAFGLIGAEANAVQPGKRPLSSMSPTIVLRDDQPILTVGAAGGPTIITQVLQVLVRVLDLQQPLSDAVAAPRIHHQWRPDELRVEESLDAATVAALKSRGHKIESTSGIGVCQAVGIDPATKQLVGVHDPRVPGAAGGT